MLLILGLHGSRIGNPLLALQFEFPDTTSFGFPIDAYMQCIYTSLVDTQLELRGQAFEWDTDKASPRAILPSTE